MLATQIQIEMCLSGNFPILVCLFVHFMEDEASWNIIPLPHFLFYHFFQHTHFSFTVKHISRPSSECKIHMDFALHMLLHGCPSMQEKHHLGIGLQPLFLLTAEVGLSAASRACLVLCPIILHFVGAAKL